MLLTGKVNGQLTDELPPEFKLDAALLKRGEQRFNIFCSNCHGLSGDGDGMIVLRGYRKPPTYHSERLRGTPIGHFFDVATNGFGVMPSYASQIPVERSLGDRRLHPRLAAHPVRQARRPPRGRAPATRKPAHRRHPVAERSVTAAPNQQPAARSPLQFAVGAIVVGAIVGAIGWNQNHHQFFASYLVAWLFWNGLALGSMALLLLHNLTGGKWMEPVRPYLRAAAGLIPVMAILFIPIALNLKQIYEWADLEHRRS